MSTTLLMPGAQLSQECIDELVDGHYRAEEAGDLASMVAGILPRAEHDVVGRPGPALHGRAESEAFYCAPLAQLRIDRFEVGQRPAHGPWSPVRGLCWFASTGR